MNEMVLIIARVRRAMPRNLDVMALCDELERLMREPVEPVKGSGFDKTAYQREYMKAYRARKRA